ncbi:MAG TPA: histidine phosphatase family protein [Methylomirabilota bacterium]|nr:histidine phosphatase family protein [Methylomirabilota bacterium]
METIYLVRHGQDLDNKNGILNGRRNEPLTNKGIEQAEELADMIKNTEIVFDHIYFSPLQRAFKTAKIISETVGLPEPEILSDLIERDFGIMTGKPQSKIIEMCSPDILVTDTITYFLNPQGAETFPELIQRAKKLLTYLEKRHENGNILLVCHGDIGKMIYAAYYNLNWDDVLKMFHFGNSDLLELSSTSKPEDAHVFKIQQHNL